MVAGFIYPSLCPSCRVEVATDQGLCPDCWRDTSFVAGQACCHCGLPVAAGLGIHAICDGCSHTRPAWNRGACALIYEGTGRRLVLGLKHNDRLDIATLAAGWMMRIGGHLVEEADLIAPVPLHWRRALRRKFNQSGELARELTVLADREQTLSIDLLRRRGWSGSQDGRSRQARIENVATAFDLSEKSRDRIAGKSVLLIDDVLTTGATLSACAALCEEAGARNVNILAMARVAREDWPT